MSKLAFSQLGERLCFDFLNTANWSSHGKVVEEKLKTVADMTSWCEMVGIYPSAAQFSETQLDKLREYRGRLRQLVVNLVDGNFSSLDLAVLNLASSKLPDSIVCIREDEIKFKAAIPLEQIIALSAITLLTDPVAVARIKVCDGANCGWFFIDESKNRRRRWCSMALCGNREKAKRYYQGKMDIERINKA